MNKLMTSWKTSLGGILSLVGGTIAVTWPEHAKVGAALQTIGTALIGLAARDNGVTSEQAGAAAKQP